MILSSDQDVIVSTLGWIDKGGLWVLDTRTGSVCTHRLSDASYLSVHLGQNGYFSVVHHYDGEQLRISTHSFADPAKSISQVVFGRSGHKFEGDTSSWRHVPRAYIAYFEHWGVGGYRLFVIEPVRPEAEFVILDWYDDSYDKGYQGLVGVVEVPGQDQVIISVQRDSNPVLYDLEKREKIMKLTLAGRRGNPTLQFRKHRAELWADDYDTIVCIDTSDWQVINSMLLQGADEGRSQFIGDYCFNRDETLCAVARPYSGDVVALDMNKFEVIFACALGDQPLSVALMSDGTVYSRDWQTGKLLQGILKNV